VPSAAALTGSPSIVALAGASARNGMSKQSPAVSTTIETSACAARESTSNV
jgi:hypothetical protein